MLKHKLLCKQNKKTIGYINFAQSHKFKHKNIYITYVYVLKKYRQQGIANYMLRYIIDYFKHKGIVWLYLWTGKQIEDNQVYKFYQKFGFEWKTYLQDYYCKGTGTRLYTLRLNK